MGRVTHQDTSRRATGAGDGMTRRRFLRHGAVAAAVGIPVGAGVTGFGRGESTASAATPSPTPLPPHQRLWAGRAQDAYDALQNCFYSDATGLYYEMFPATSPTAYAGLWPFSRALVGTMALAGIPSQFTGGQSFAADVEDRLAALAQYHDTTVSPAGYDGRVLAPAGTGGDKYYDDAAWIGLALAQHYRMTGAVSVLQAAQGVLGFVYPGGWDENPHAAFPGGVFWLQQGIGLGVTNHDRTTTSNAPNAELAYHLAQLSPGQRAGYESAGTRIHAWVTQTLYDRDGSGLVYDHVSADGTVDPTLYTYNQGALIAADAMRYRLTNDPTWLFQAQSLASAALAQFSPSYYFQHSAAFNAIYFRGLLQLHDLLPAGPLPTAITTTMAAYAEAVWNDARSPEGLYRFADSPPGYSLLDQGAVVQLFATLAWNPGDYPKLA
jgi:hypothetical protein